MLTSTMEPVSASAPVPAPVPAPAPVPVTAPALHVRDQAEVERDMSFDSFVIWACIMIGLILFDAVITAPGEISDLQHVLIIIVFTVVLLKTMDVCIKVVCPAWTTDAYVDVDAAYARTVSNRSMTAARLAKTQ
jgi:hypothetical protein